MRPISILLASLLISLTCLSADAGEDPHPLSIEEVLAITSHDELLKLLVSKTEEIANLLKRATDECSAQRIAPAAERAYLELELIGARIGMLPPPPLAQRARFSTGMNELNRAKEQLGQEYVRLHSLPASVPLARVLLPLRQCFDQADNAIQSAISTMQTLRAQIELYKLQHMDNCPDFRNQGWDQLTAKTNGQGKVSDSGRFGPYLKSVPVNPLTRSSNIFVSRSRLNSGYRHRDKNVGFVFEEPTGRFWALDADGGLLGETASASTSAE